jgi:hypothetical protein
MKLNSAFAAVVVVSLFCVLRPSHPSAQTNGEPERFTGVAVNMGSPGRAGADQVEIVVNRWSTETERTRLLQTLFDKGPEKLLETLTDLPRVGYFRTPTSIAYDLHYAHRESQPDRGERIVLATDRYINFWEARNQPRSIDYPFTVIELHFDGDGKGEGKMSIATKITAEKESRTIVLENYATQPVMLNEIRRQKR